MEVVKKYGYSFLSVHTLDISSALQYLDTKPTPTCKYLGNLMSINNVHHKNTNSGDHFYKNHFFLTSIFEAFFFLKSCPILDELTFIVGRSTVVINPRLSDLKEPGIGLEVLGISSNRNILHIRTNSQKGTGTKIAEKLNNFEKFERN